MARTRIFNLALTIVLACAASLVATGCANDSNGASGAASSEQEQEQSASSGEQAAQASEQGEAAATQPAALDDGDYTIEADTDSSMFRIEECTLHVQDGTYSATISLPGEGFSRLYFGTAEEAASASDDDIYDYYENDSGLYTFDIPVPALDEEVHVAAFGHRRDTWYDHTIEFFSPSADMQAAA